MPDSTYPDSDAGTPERRFDLLARVTDPNRRTMYVLRVLAVLLGAFFATYYSLAVGLFVAALVALPLQGLRRWRVGQLTAEAHACLVRLIRSAEYEADRAQDRRLWWRVIRTGNWMALFTSTAWEDSRTRVRPGRYIRLSILGGGMWPAKAHVADVMVRWAPLVEINHGDIRERILAQVAAWWGLRPEDVEAPDGWDTARYRVRVRRKAASVLPTSVPYPGEETREDRGDREDREAGGRPGGAYDPGKPRWSNSPYDEGPL